ncbi:hypothetical protein [Intestinimonas sp.]|uniref:hypothetical protein n=1 Tax=Intestinimonas sp. TaxID=1965293 RepID=UPI0026304AB0|nr:hypothetical protein [Intestinimonas sp.]
MNKNYFSDGIMRRMRQYTLALSKYAHSKDKDMENILSLKKADEITQTVYDREVEKINQQIGDQRKKLLSEVQADLMGTFDKMREIAKTQISKAPTPEMVSTLQILSMLDNITPTQFSLYAEQMADCPLAMQRLQQIATAHNQRIVIDDPDTKLRALDTLEGHLVNFLNSYDGVEEHCPYSVRDMYRYFRPDDQYMGNRCSPTDTDKVNEQFWDEFVGMSSFKVFEDPNAIPGKPKAQYFFTDVKALSAFLKKMTEVEGITDSMVEETEEIILKNCPERYGAVLRNYRSTGEIMDLNEPSI